MELETCWIMTNIACGPEEVTKELFYQETTGSGKQLPVLQMVRKFLESDVSAQ